jgi:hypothetical protein
VEDYPRNLREFDTRFSNEDGCREYLFKLRWPDGFCCPRCGGNKSWPGRGVLRVCAGCGYQSSVTAGTIFQDTRTPLRLWFQAMWWMTTQKNGASALGLQRVLGLKQYQTAWTWLHKLRSAMVRPGRDLLTGRVEVDECYLGGLEEGLRGRLIESKALIIVAAQEDGRRIGRIRLHLIPDASAESLHRFNWTPLPRAAWSIRMGGGVIPASTPKATSTRSRSLKARRSLPPIFFLVRTLSSRS